MSTKWESVPLEGFSFSTDDLNGFVGLEECTSYDFHKESKRPKKKKEERKRKHTVESNIKEVPSKKAKRKPNDIENKPENSHASIKEQPKQNAKKIKLSNRFVVKSPSYLTTPSQTYEISSVSDTESIPKAKERSKRNERRKKNKEKRELKALTTQSTKKKEKPKDKIKKPKLGEENTQTSDLTPEDMLTWAEFKLQDSIVKALMELGFKKPTKIQQLTLPAAIHGRRDILGAAETGSGKTLAFGLPILTGILKLKEKAESKGLDVYDIPYKKGAAKPKQKAELPKKVNIKKKNIVAKNSSEHGYSDGDEDSSTAVIKKKKTMFKKAEDNHKNYVHLSDMIDFGDISNEETESVEDDVATDNIDSDDDVATDNIDSYDNVGSEDEIDDNEDSDDDVATDNIDSYDNVGSEDEIDDNEDSDDDVATDNIDSYDNVGSEDEIDDNEPGVEDCDGMEAVSDEDVEDSGNADEGGIGCVKVEDNIQIPGHVVVKTGKPLYALILTPTRELAIQISRHLIAAAKYTGIKVATIVGGMAHVKQERLLRGGPEIVVATPGRLWELIGQGQAHLQQLHTVKFLAIDETDRMMERGHFEELTPLLERLNVDEERRSARQNFVFSATLTLVHDLPAHMRGKKVTRHGKILNCKVKQMTPEQKVKRLVDFLGMTEPKVVDITTNLGTAESLTECKITCDLQQKDAILFYILKRHPGRTIVFCNSISCVKGLAALLTLIKCNPLPLHGCMPQRQRLKNLERFRDNPHGVLIATDVAARGLDIPLVDHVIQYQVPRTAENYVHRSGRTARAEREGINVLMVESADAHLYSKLCQTLNKTSEVPSFPVDPHILAPLKELMAVAKDLHALEQKKRRNTLECGWRERTAREMDIIIDDENFPTQQAGPNIDRALKAKRNRLEAMLSRPIIPKGFSFKYPTLNDPMALNMPQEKALEVMKEALESGKMKKERRKSKNAPLLKLGKGVHWNKKQ